MCQGSHQRLSLEEGDDLAEKEEEEDNKANNKRPSTKTAVRHAAANDFGGRQHRQSDGFEEDEELPDTLVSEKQHGKVSGRRKRRGGAEAEEFASEDPSLLPAAGGRRRREAIYAGVSGNSYDYSLDDVMEGYPTGDLAVPDGSMHGNGIPGVAIGIGKRRRGLPGGEPLSNGDGMESNGCWGDVMDPTLLDGLEQWCSVSAVLEQQRQQQQDAAVLTRALLEAMADLQSDEQHPAMQQVWGDWMYVVYAYERSSSSCILGAPTHSH